MAGMLLLLAYGLLILGGIMVLIAGVSRGNPVGAGRPVSARDCPSHLCHYVLERSEERDLGSARGNSRGNPGGRHGSSLTGTGQLHPAF